MSANGVLSLREGNGKPKTSAVLDRDGDESGDAIELKRVHVIFPRPVYSKLHNLAKRKGVTVTEALRQAIYLADHIERAIHEDNATVIIDRQGEKSTIVVP